MRDRGRHGARSSVQGGDGERRARPRRRRRRPDPRPDRKEGLRPRVRHGRLPAHRGTGADVRRRPRVHPRASHPHRRPRGARRRPRATSRGAMDSQIIRQSVPRSHRPALIVTPRRFAHDAQHAGRYHRRATDAAAGRRGGYAASQAAWVQGAVLGCDDALRGDAGGHRRGREPGPDTRAFMR